MNGINKTALPDLQSEYAILRMRSVWLYSKIMSEDNLSDMIKANTILKIVDAFGECIVSDKNLAVKT